MIRSLLLTLFALLSFQCVEAPMSLIGQGTATISDGLDTSKWLGAWDFSSSPSPNLLSSPLGTMGAFTGGSPPADSDITGGLFRVGVTGAAFPYIIELASAPLSQPANAQVSYAFYISSAGNDPEFAVLNGADSHVSLHVHLGYTTCFDDYGVEPLRVGGTAGEYIPTYPGNTNHGLQLITPGGSGHFVFICDDTAQTIKVYKNGALALTLTTGANWGSMSPSQMTFQQTFSTGGITTGTRVCAYLGALPESAIAQLAAGAMPNAAGILTLP